jgi:hypothetical protein
LSFSIAKFDGGREILPHHSIVFQGARPYKYGLVLCVVFVNRDAQSFPVVLGRIFDDKVRSRNKQPIVEWNV